MPTCGTSFARTGGLLRVACIYTLPWVLLLVLCYAMSGTGLAYGGTRCLVLTSRMMLGSRLLLRLCPPPRHAPAPVRAPPSLRASYAVSGTDVVYAGRLPMHTLLLVSGTDVAHAACAPMHRGCSSMCYVSTGHGIGCA
eukprot:3407389-Rhodomonas_salina.2